MVKSDQHRKGGGGVKSKSNQKFWGEGGFVLFSEPKVAAVMVGPYFMFLFQFTEKVTSSMVSNSDGTFIRKTRHIFSSFIFRDLATKHLPLSMVSRLSQKFQEPETNFFGENTT